MTGLDPSSAGLSPAGLSRLGGLLAGLDRLDPILALPAYPAVADLPFGPYRLRGRLGAGACGVVLLADDPRLGRPVVVKVPQPAVLTDPAARERFVREARAAAVLDHPGIVPVFEAGEVGGLPYFAAGYVAGPTLAAWLADRPGPVPPDEAARLVGALARAVHHAHEHGVLHCDLKPSNVLLATPAEGGPADPVVTDFGMARILTDDPSQTLTYQQAGTPLYMSPEQARGDRRGLTARTDVYALGVLLFELLTGRPPFAGTTGSAVLEAVRQAPAPCPRAVNPGVPRDLRAICLGCLAKEPKDRYASAAALADDLDLYLGGFPVTTRRVGLLTRSARWARRNPVPVAVTIALVFLAAGLGVVVEDRWATGVRHRADLAEAEQRTAERAAAGEFVDILEQVRRRRTELEPNWPAENLADLKTLTASPVAAGRQAALRTEAAAAFGGVDLGVPRVVAEGFDAYTPAFSPDGKTLALGSWRADEPGKCSVRLLDPATGTVRQTIRYNTDIGWEQRYSQFKQMNQKDIDGCRSLTFSPDGRWLVLGTRSGWLMRWDLKGKSRASVRWRHAAPFENPADDRVEQLAFTPSGQVLVSSDDRRMFGWGVRQGWAQVIAHTVLWIDVVRQARADDPLFVRLGFSLHQVVDGPPWTRPYENPVLGGRTAAAPAGTLVVTHSGNQCRPYALWPGHRVDPSELMSGFTGPNDARTDDGPVDTMVVSPDGLYLATGSQHIGHLKLWSVVSGQLLSARTFGGGSLNLAFSADGRTLAVCDKSRTLLFSLAPPGAATGVALQPYPLADAAVSPTTTTVFGQDALGAAFVHAFGTTGRPGWGDGRRVLDRDPPKVPIQAGPPGGLNSRATAVAPDGNFHAFAVKDAVYRQPPNGPIIGRPVQSLRDMAFAPDGRLWLAGRDVIGWAPDGTDVRVALPGSDGGARPSAVCLAVGPGILLAGGSEGALSLIDPATGALTRTVPVFDTPLTGLGTRDELAIAGSALGAVKVIRLASGTTELELPDAHRDVITAVAVGPAGWFSTGSRDRTVKVWGPAGELVFTLSQTRPVKRLFWSPDGQTLTIAVEGDRGLRRWDLAALKAGLTDLGLRPDLP